MLSVLFVAIPVNGDASENVKSVAPENAAPMIGGPTLMSWTFKMPDESFGTCAGAVGPVFCTAPNANMAGRTENACITGPKSYRTRKSLVRQVVFVPMSRSYVKRV